MIDKVEDKRNRLETALFKWLDDVEIIEKDVLELTEHNTISRSKIAKDMDKMKTRLLTLENNLRNYK